MTKLRAGKRKMIGKISKYNFEFSYGHAEGCRGNFKIICHSLARFSIYLLCYVYFISWEIFILKPL